MAIIDFILNIAGLLLWLSWRSAQADPLAKRSPLTLAGTLKGPEANRLGAWQALVALVVLLVLRAGLYWQIGPSADWTPRIDLFFVALAFRADDWQAALLFSGLSFLRTLVIFHFWLLTLSFINRSQPETDSMHRLVRSQLGVVGRWPRAVQFILPAVGVTLLWAVLSPVLVQAGVIERTTAPQVLKQGLFVSGSLYLSLKFLLPAFLLSDLVLTYVYLGQSPILEYVSATARRLTAPLKWLPLSFGRIDLTPVLSAIVILLLLDALPRYLTAHAQFQAVAWPQ